MEHVPIVSVIIATYNRAKLLPRAIDSLLAQTFEDWELLVMDDGGTDQTEKVVAPYRRQLQTISYQKLRHAGHAAARNEGLKKSRGRYITFLDSDDEYTPDHLEVRVTFSREHPEVDFVHGGLQIVGGSPYVPDKHNPIRKIHLKHCGVGGTYFGKRSVFIELEGFKNWQYFDDSDFLERAERKFNTRRVNFPTYIYHRETPDSLMNQFSLEDTVKLRAPGSRL